MTDWRGTLARQPVHARSLLRELLEEPLQATPIIEAKRRGFRLDGNLAVGEVLFGKLRGNEFGVPGGKNT